MNHVLVGGSYLGRVSFKSVVVGKVQDVAFNDVVNVLTVGIMDIAVMVNG